MKTLARSELHALAVANLGLDSTSVDLGTTEALAAAIRRAAGFHCPCSAKTLLRAVLQPLAGLVDDFPATEEAALETLEAVVAYGDLLEQRPVVIGQEGRPLLYAAPPAFVMRRSGSAMLIGIAADQPSPLPQGLQDLIEYFNHVRRLPADPGGGDRRGQLTGLGLIELSSEAWLKAPSPETYNQCLARVNISLAAAPPTVDISGMMLLDPVQPVRYYRGRWVEHMKNSGRFIGRRPQAYGADLWCYIELEKGVPRKFLDLPLPRSPMRGCDEAWRIQAAIDAQRNEPQQFRVRRGSAGWVVLDLFSPVPMWAQRRWDAVGEPLPKGSGSLFSYRFRQTEIEEEIQFARDILWLAELK
jgi:hypothetical protein